MYQGSFISRLDSEGKHQVIPHGQGLYLNSDGDLFTGQFRDGKRLCGTLLFHNGSKYEGSFNENEVPHGPGILTLSDGRSYNGTFANNRIHGKGIFYKFVPGCPFATFKGTSIEGAFFSDVNYQSNEALPQFTTSYTDSFVASARQFLISITSEVDSLISNGLDDTNPELHPFVSKYLLKNEGVTGGLETDFCPIQGRPTLRSLCVRLPQLQLLVDNIDEVVINCASTAPEGYTEQLKYLGQLIVITSEKVPDFTISLVNTQEGLRVASVPTLPDEEKAFTALYAKKKK